MTEQSLQEYLEALKSKGWRVELWQGATAPALDSSITERYPNIPADYLDFLQRVKSCVNEEETVWFLCLDDYNSTSDSGWAWNEMEKTDIEEADEKTRARVVEFWDRHLPFMFSVGGEYAYLAFRVGEERFGSVVEAWEDLTEVTERARSFEEFVRLHVAALNGDRDHMLFDYI